MEFISRLKTVCLVIGLLMSITSIMADEKINGLDRMMYTINPAAHINGPIFRDRSTQFEKDRYVSNVIRLILKEADNRAKKYLEAGDTEAYYTFLTLALTVPMHEGLYLQFRNIDENLCLEKVNSGERIKKLNKNTFQIFSRYLKSGDKPFIPDCETLSSEKSSTQIIRGGDGSDLTMMQLSMRWHVDDFLALKKYENVQKTLQYGMEILINGFDTVYRNVDQYECLSKNNKINYINVIRGVWAGKYNSGSIKKTCRFSNKNSPYKMHDINFVHNLNKILNFNETLNVDIVGKFAINKQESDAISEIIMNLHNKTNNRVALPKLLERM